MAVSAPVLCEPLKDLLPLQPPAAAHDAALAEVQLNRALAPLATDPGNTVSVATGSTWIVTLTTVFVPPAAVQVSENVVSAVSAPVLCEPLNDLLPVHPPDAVQVDAFDELQIRVDPPPLLTVFCEVLIDAVGGGAETEGPPPPQDANSSSHATVDQSRYESFMPFRGILQIRITVTLVDCNSRSQQRQVSS